MSRRVPLNAIVGYCIVGEEEAPATPGPAVSVDARLA
jgi:hypothetical protein